MSLWAALTGAGKAADVIDKGLDIVGLGAKGLDAAWYTEEEKAGDAAKGMASNMQQAYAFAKLAQSESGASAITRRLAILIVLGNFTLFTISGLAAIWLEKTKVLEATVGFAQAMSVGQLAMTVVVSVCGYYAWTGKKK